ncbi:hypothetical protein ACIP69_18460 [Streptomyces hygroscopicus]|uniref:hypothetical protein n=1 Tax=Streptomyces hygroscopicus TaxID=1912 RepID=UPI0037F97730
MADISQDPACDHDWYATKPAGAKISIRLCRLCHHVDADDLNRSLDEYAEAWKPKPTTLTYAWSDGHTFSLVDQPGGVPDSERERALLRALLTHSLTALDRHDDPMGIAFTERPMTT